MSRLNMEDFKLRGARHGSGFFLDSVSVDGALVTNPFVLTADTPTLLFLGPTGAVNLRMPPSTPANKGLVFVIVNTGTAAITIVTDGGAAFAPNAVVAAVGQATILICTGSSTAALGWRALTAAGTQTSP